MQTLCVLSCQSLFGKYTESLSRIVEVSAKFLSVCVVAA